VRPQVLRRGPPRSSCPTPSPRPAGRRPRSAVGAVWCGPSSRNGRRTRGSLRCPVAGSGSAVACRACRSRSSSARPIGRPVCRVSCSRGGASLPQAKRAGLSDLPTAIWRSEAAVPSPCGTCPATTAAGDAAFDDLSDKLGTADAEALRLRVEIGDHAFVRADEKREAAFAVSGLSVGWAIQIVTATRLEF